MSWPLTSDLFSLICRSSSLWESDGGWQPDTAVRPGERPAGCPVTLPTLLHAVQENTGQSTQAFCVYWEAPIYMTWNWRWGMVGSVEFGSGAQQGHRIAWHWLIDRHVCCETFHLDIHEKVSFTIYHWSYWWIGAEQATSRFLNQWWQRFMLSYSISRTHWVNSLRPSDAIWRHRSMSTLVQVMAWCCQAASHYLNQCWLVISKVLWGSREDNFTRDTSAVNHKHWLEKYISKISFKFPRVKWLNIYW